MPRGDDLGPVIETGEATGFYGRLAVEDDLPAILELGVQAFACQDHPVKPRGMEAGSRNAGALEPRLIGFDV